MKRIHKQEREQFKKLFKQEKVDRLEERIRVMDAFLETEQHVTASELNELLLKRGCTVDRQFVHETLALLCRFGFARKNRFENGEVRYEHHHIGQHHDHMVCTKCGSIIEFHDPQLEQLQVQIAGRYGFHMLQHKMELYGICSRCLQSDEHTMPLSMARQGDSIRIMEFSGGPRCQMRLLSMGLRIGDFVEVITNHGRGQMVIAVDCKRYVIGKGLAQKMLVERVTGDTKRDPVRLSRMKEGQSGTVTRSGAMAL
jgi:Fur family ferric uptake transcriptional regulator